MTAQAGERLFYKGEETWMAAEPLNQYLQNRNDIKYNTPQLLDQKVSYAKLIFFAVLCSILV